MRKEDKQLIFVFSVIAFLHFGAIAASTFLPLFLREVGLNSVQLGNITSLGSILGFLFLPLWGTISDSIRSSRPVFMFCMGATALIFAALPVLGEKFSGYLLPFYILIPMVSIFKLPLTSLLDGWIISKTAPRKINYGTIRMWGSIGFSVISLTFSGFIIKKTGTGFSFYLFGVIAIIIILLGYYLKEAPIEKKPSLQKKEKLPFTSLFRNYYFVTYVIYTLGINIYMSVTLVFMSYILEYAGSPASLLGIVSGYRALAEITSMFLTKKLRKHMTLARILSIAGFLFATEHLLYRYATSIVHIMVLATFSGMAGGIAYSMGPTYIHEIVSEEFRNTAQSFNAITMTLVGIIGTFAGGHIIKTYGIQWLTTGCGIIILLLTILFTLSIPYGRNVLHLDSPENSSSRNF